MTNILAFRRSAPVLLVLLTFTSGASSGEERLNPDRGSRVELWLGATNWPALGGLQPRVAGSFDAVGFGLGGGFHVPIRKFENSELLIGVDAFLTTTESNITGIIDKLIARNMYFGTSAKYRFSKARNYSLDAGLGYHLADIADVDSDYLGTGENQSWESSRLGVFIGTTWDVGVGRPGKNRGVFLGLKVHFVDFGTVHDEEISFLPVLGPDAGRLDGPIYMLQVGYSGQ